MFKISSSIKSVSSIKFNSIIKSMLHLPLSQKQKHYRMLPFLVTLKLESKSKMLWVTLGNFLN